MDAEEIEEIQDEYANPLEVLESLIEEFEARVSQTFDAATDGLDSLTTFWNDYWVCRMSQVLFELSEADETSKSAAEDLGVIWGPEPERGICVETRLNDWEGWEECESCEGWEGWDYYLKRIDEIE